MTQPIPTNLATFETYPPLSRLLGEPPMPGVQYAYVLTANIGKAQRDGYHLLAGVPIFEVRGAEMAVVWRGSPIHDIPRVSYKAKLLVDAEADEVTELTPTTVEERPNGEARVKSETK